MDPLVPALAFDLPLRQLVVKESGKIVQALSDERLYTAAGLRFLNAPNSLELSFLLFLFFVIV